MLIPAGKPAVVLSAQTCAWLEQYADLTRVRVQVRGTIPLISAELGEVREAAVKWLTSATGSPIAPAAEVPASSGPWLSTSEAGDLLGITSRGVRLACQAGRIEAEQVAGRYRISRAVVEHHRAARRAA